MKWRDDPMDYGEARKLSSPALTYVTWVLLLALFIWGFSDLLAWHPLAPIGGMVACLGLGTVVGEAR